MTPTRKGSKIELCTFMSYGKSEIIGHKAKEKEGTKFINMIWCKVCARNKDGILGHPSLRGSMKVSALAFINAVSLLSFIIKHLF